MSNPANVPGMAAGSGLSVWAPTTHIGDPDGVHGCWLQVGLALVHLGGESARGRSLFLPLSLLLCLLNKCLLKLELIETRQNKGSCQGIHFGELGRL